MKALNCSRKFYASIESQIICLMHETPTSFNTVDEMWYVLHQIGTAMYDLYTVLEHEHGYGADEFSSVIHDHLSGIYYVDGIEHMPTYHHDMNDNGTFKPMIVNRVIENGMATISYNNGCGERFETIPVLAGKFREGNMSLADFTADVEHILNNYYSVDDWCAARDCAAKMVIGLSAKYLDEQCDYS